jgi:hypothetical protein
MAEREREEEGTEGENGICCKHTEKKEDEADVSASR